MRLKHLACAASLFLLAQTASAQMPTRTTNIYFDTNADSLDQNARRALDSLAQASKNWGEYQINIVAYTDDRGSNAQNLDLAQRRAASVDKYLVSAQFTSSNTEVKAAGELVLKAKSDPESARREMRRVEIRVQCQNPQSVSDLFNYFSQKEQQFFTIADPKQPQTIKGQKGTRINIPANSLVRADGRLAKGPVQVELREAYAFGDMLAQNLGTTSGKELLQTGGMFFIEAKDADGQVLSLADGKKADISMPQSQPLPDGMQIFVADRAGDHNEGAIDWQATNQPFAPRAFAEREQRPNLSYPLNTIPVTVHDRKQLEKSSDFLKTGPQYAHLIPKNKCTLPSPFKLQAPEKPIANSLRLPNKDRIAKENPRHETEARKAYKSRLKNIYSQESHAYDSLLADNRARTKAYHLAQNEYNRQKQAYEKAYRQHQSYTDSLALSVLAVFKHYKGSRNYAYARTWAINTRSAWITNYNILNQAPLANILGAQREDSRFADLLDMQNQLDSQYNQFKAELNAYGLENIQKLFPQDFGAFDSIAQLPIFAGVNGSLNLTAYSDGRSIDNIKKSFANIDEFIQAAEAFLSTEAPKLHRQSRHAEYAACLEAFYNSPLIALSTAADSINKKFMAINKLHRDRCLELGLLSDGDAREALASVSRLGWVNCDRFLKYPPSECVHFTLNYDDTYNSQFFIVVPAISSIVPLSGAGNKFVCQQYNGIPKALKAKLVGIRVENGKPAIYVAENTVEALQRSKVNFRDCTIEEAKRAIAAL